MKSYRDMLWRGIAGNKVTQVLLAVLFVIFIQSFVNVAYAENSIWQAEGVTYIQEFAPVDVECAESTIEVFDMKTNDFPLVRRDACIVSSPGINVAFIVIQTVI